MISRKNLGCRPRETCPRESGERGPSTPGTRVAMRRRHIERSVVTGFPLARERQWGVARCCGMHRSRVPARRAPRCRVWARCRPAPASRDPGATRRATRSVILRFALFALGPGSRSALLQSPGTREFGSSTTSRHPRNVVPAKVGTHRASHGVFWNTGFPLARERQRGQSASGVQIRHTTAGRRRGRDHHFGRRRIVEASDVLLA
jgi:hypothetical protein